MRNDRQKEFRFSILRVARLSDRETAMRLVIALAVDFPVSNTRPEVTALHQTAIATRPPDVAQRRAAPVSVAAKAGSVPTVMRKMRT